MSFGSSNRQASPKKKLAGIDENRLNTHQQAIPVAYMAGRRRIALHWFTPAYDQVNEKVKQKVGKGDEQETGTIIYASLAGMICLGGRKPVDRLYRHFYENEKVWENAAGLARDLDPYEPVTIPNVGSTRIYWGSEDQPRDTLVLTPKGTLPPGADSRDQTTWPDSDQTQHHPTGTNEP